MVWCSVKKKAQGQLCLYYVFVQYVNIAGIDQELCSSHFQTLLIFLDPS